MTNWGSTLPNALTAISTPEMDWQAMAQEVEDLKGKIERLGNVTSMPCGAGGVGNRGRHAANSAYRPREAKRQTGTTHRQDQSESEDLFRSSFAAIRKLRRAVRKLFGGGRAEIVLEDPNNVLDGIDRRARPANSSRASPALGGKKTMTAVALLLAIFKSASPLCATSDW